LLGRGTLPILRKKFGLKKPRDFTVSEGHRYPLVLNNFNCKRRRKKRWSGFFKRRRRRKGKNGLAIAGEMGGL
jgi:hypothetical protein